MRVCQVSAVIACLVAINIVRAEDVQSGPKAGDKVAALKALVATGDNAGKELDISAERKDKPTVYIFIDADQFSRPIARCLKVLDGAVNNIPDGGGPVAVRFRHVKGGADCGDQLDSVGGKRGIQDGAS